MHDPVGLLFTAMACGVHIAYALDAAVDRRLLFFVWCSSMVAVFGVWSAHLMQ